MKFSSAYDVCTRPKGNKFKFYFHYSTLGLQDGLLPNTTAKQKEQASGQEFGSLAFHRVLVNVAYLPNTSSFIQNLISAITIDTIRPL